MARQGSRILDSGDAFPEIEMNLASGGKMQIPSGLGNDWKVILFYRGHF